MFLRHRFLTLLFPCFLNAFECRLGGVATDAHLITNQNELSYNGDLLGVELALFQHKHSTIFFEISCHLSEGAMQNFSLPSSLVHVSEAKGLIGYCYQLDPQQVFSFTPYLGYAFNYLSLHNITRYFSYSVPLGGFFNYNPTKITSAALHLEWIPQIQSYKENREEPNTYLGLIPLYGMKAAVPFRVGLDRYNYLSITCTPFWEWFPYGSVKTSPLSDDLVELYLLGISIALTAQF